MTVTLRCVTCGHPRTASSGIWSSKRPGPGAPPTRRWCSRVASWCWGGTRRTLVQVAASATCGRGAARRGTICPNGKCSPHKGRGRGGAATASWCLTGRSLSSGGGRMWGASTTSTRRRTGASGTSLRRRPHGHRGPHLVRLSWADSCMWWAACRRIMIAFTTTCIGPSTAPRGRPSVSPRRGPAASASPP